MAIIPEFEVYLINRYAASELAGALYLGKWARVVKDSFLRHKLTWHCYEEARHAKLWYDLIDNLKIPSIEVHDSEGDELFAYERENKIENIIEFLVGTHIHELRVPFHFVMHSRVTNNKRIKELLLQLVEEEGPHLVWIRKYLKEEKNKGNSKVNEYLNKYFKISMEEYYKDLDKIELKWPESKEFTNFIREKLPELKGLMEKAISLI